MFAVTLNVTQPTPSLWIPVPVAPAPLPQDGPTIAPPLMDQAHLSAESCLEEMTEAIAIVTEALLATLGAPPEPAPNSNTASSNQANSTSRISQTAGTTSSTRSLGQSMANAQDPASFYITQNQSEYNPNGSINANCGPASLAMAALAFGKVPPGTSKDDPEGLIRAVRQQMTGNQDIHELTGEDDVARGAQALGMSSAPVSSVGDVDAALAAGKMVVAGGDPSAYSHGSGGHFVLITGRSADGGYVMNDPAYTGKPGVTLTPEQFQAFFGDGVAVGP